MEDSREPAAIPLRHEPASRQSGRRWLRLQVIALALTLTFGVGAFLGVLGATRSASLAQAAPDMAGGAPTSRSVAIVLRSGRSLPDGVDTRPVPSAGTAGMPDQCGGKLTVTQVSGRTITVTRADGSTATIHVTSHTHYTRSGHAVAASAVTAGSKIYVVGACTGQGRSIKATSIEVVG